MVSVMGRRSRCCSPALLPCISSMQQICEQHQVRAEDTPETPPAAGVPHEHSAATTHSVLTSVLILYPRASIARYTCAASTMRPVDALPTLMEAEFKVLEGLLVLRQPVENLLPGLPTLMVSECKVRNGSLETQAVLQTACSCDLDLDLCSQCLYTDMYQITYNHMHQIPTIVLTSRPKY